MDTCPFPDCGAVVVNRCRCPRSDSTCAKGHKWHYSQRDGKRVVHAGHTSHSALWSCEHCEELGGKVAEERSADLTWEQKLAAIQALLGSYEVCLRMRQPGNWYVDTKGREITSDDSGILSSEYGNGRSPQEAVENDWRKCVDELPAHQYIVLNAGVKGRRHVRWNGYMWADVS